MKKRRTYREETVDLHRQIGMFDVLYVDSFAGGGGASTGIELATGHPVDIAINHDESAIMMHQRNHPFTKHYREDIWKVDPIKATGGQKVRLAWFSPDCKHFSRAKGAALVDKHIRGLAWVVLRWAGTVHPDIIMLENVPEFVTWGPVRKGRPVKSKAGQTYRKWYQQLRDLGYEIETKELCAADYGAPTIRTRFYLIARRDGKPVVWPKRTHAPAGSREVRQGKCKTWRMAAEIINWNLPAYSIFESKKEIKEKYGATVVRPLRSNTMNRIAGGLDKFVIKADKPFIVEKEAPYFIQYHQETTKGTRGQRVDEPIRTIDASNRYGLTTAYLSEYYGNGRPGIDIRKPAQTITAKDRECLTLAYIAEFKGKDKGQHPEAPLRTITAGDGQFAAVKTVVKRYGNTLKDLKHWPEIREMLNRYRGYDLKEDEVLLMQIDGTDHFISDIAIRMLSPRELYNAMGFPPDYIIDRDVAGKKISRADQVARCGNAVCPAVSEALARANLPECRKKKISTMNELHDAMCS